MSVVLHEDVHAFIGILDPVLASVDGAALRPELGLADLDRDVLAPGL